LTVYVTVDFIGLIYFYWIMEYVYINLRKVLMDTTWIFFYLIFFKAIMNSLRWKIMRGLIYSFFPYLTALAFVLY